MQPISPDPSSNPLPLPNRDRVREERTDQVPRGDLGPLIDALPARRTLREEYALARAARLSLLLPDSADFPEPLRALGRPPSFLYRRGAPYTVAPTVAVVGSRRASDAGERTAFRIGKELAEEGWRVVSGLARGIDRAVLEGAVSSGGSPIAVLGNGLPAIYPVEHFDLADRIVSVGGALYCELPVGAPPRRQNFPRRNRLISALSRGVVVVEATERSGSLITAAWALEQGREVLAVPGPIEGPGHAGCHRLIRDGATLVTSVEEIVDALRDAGPAAAGVPAALRSAFEAGERDLARLAEITGLPTARLLEGWRALLAEREPSLSEPGEPHPPRADESASLS